MLPCTLLCPCWTTSGDGCLWTSCHCCHASRAVLPMLVEVWPAMSRLSERHILKTKSVKLLTVPTHGCSTVKRRAHYQLSRATVQPTKACQSSSTAVSHQGKSSHIVHVGIVTGVELKHTIYKSSIANYELCEGNSPFWFYATLHQHGIDQYATTPS